MKSLTGSDHLLSITEVRDRIQALVPSDPVLTNHTSFNVSLKYHR